MAKLIDITAEDHGSIFLLRGATRRGRRWIEEHISDERQEWCGAIVVEHRYIFDIARGAIADGLRVRRLFVSTDVKPSSFFECSDIAGADDALVPPRMTT
jgi:hypothetical protein